VTLRVVGAGLPRTATRSLKDALERLLGGRCYHMAEVFEHLDEVPTWRAATRGDEVDWRSFPPDCVAAVDWPASAFWRELADANPDAVILLSTRESAAKWWESADETIFPVLRKPVEQPENEEWQQMALELAAREIGPNWDNAERAQAFYERHTSRCGARLRRAGFSIGGPATAGSRCAGRSACRCPTSRSHGSTRGRNGSRVRSSDPVPRGYSPRMAVDRLELLLRDAFPDAPELRVEDRTGGGDHFQVTVESPRFDGLPLLEQHRLVNDALAEPLRDGTIHELRIKTKGTT
jgi:stress-induced morphogen